MEEESECVEPVVECLGEEDEAFNLVEELQRSTMMRTRDRYKSSTGIVQVSDPNILRIFPR